jgi:hypothetical protein
MKFAGPLSFLFFGCLLFSCSSNKKLAEEQSLSHFKGSTVKTIAIDGNDADWQGLPTAMSPGNDFSYSIARDEKALYLLVKIDNPMEQTKLLRGGMEVWIDPTDKKSKTTEVIFPVKGELSETAMRPQNPSTDPKVNREMMHLNIKAALISLNRIGFKPEYSGVQTISEATGFKGAINWTADNELIYELQVPFAAFPEPLSKEAFDINFSIGGVERAVNTSGRGEGNGEWRGSGGMGRGGRMGGGGRYGGGGYGRGQGRTGGENQAGNNDWKKLTEKESFWVECSL